MARRTKIVGRGITTREVHEADGADMGPAFRGFAQRWNDLMKTHERNVYAAATAETIAPWKDVLMEAGAGPYVEDSLEDFANRIVQSHERAMREIKDGNAAGAARSAFAAGSDCALALMKFQHEAAALSGHKVRRGNEKSKVARAEQARRSVMDAWGATALAIAREEMAARPQSSRAHLERTIRKHWPTVSSRSTLPEERAILRFLERNGL